MQIRIQKFLSQTGICSRRQAEEYIKKGLVRLNNEVVTNLATKIDQKRDKVELNNKLIKSKAYIYLALNKPIGYVSSFSHKDKKTLTSLVKIKEHLGYAGRLDEDSEGLMLLTNDGDLIYKLTHPKFEHEKEYLVEVYKPIPEAIIQRISKGMKLFEGKTNPVKIYRLTSNKARIILNEGKKRQIRRMFQIVGFEVKNLKRVRIENILLGDLKSGQTRELSKEELIELKKRVSLD